MLLRLELRIKLRHAQNGKRYHEYTQSVGVLGCISRFTEGHKGLNTLHDQCNVKYISNNLTSLTVPQQILWQHEISLYHLVPRASVLYFLKDSLGP